jgi:hypothetical protein
MDPLPYVMPNSSINLPPSLSIISQTLVALGTMEMGWDGAKVKGWRRDGTLLPSGLRKAIKGRWSKSIRQDEGESPYRPPFLPPFLPSNACREKISLKFITLIDFNQQGSEFCFVLPFSRLHFTQHGKMQMIILNIEQKNSYRDHPSILIGKRWFKSAQNWLI